MKKTFAFAIRYCICALAYCFSNVSLVGSILPFADGTRRVFLSCAASVIFVSLLFLNKYVGAAASVALPLLPFLAGFCFYLANGWAETLDVLKTQIPQGVWLWLLALCFALYFAVFTFRRLYVSPCVLLAAVSYALPRIFKGDYPAWCVLISLFSLLLIFLLKKLETAPANKSLQTLFPEPSKFLQTAVLSALAVALAAAVPFFPLFGKENGANQPDGGRQPGQTITQAQPVQTTGFSNQAVVGGNLQIDETPVMEVTSAAPLYLVGAVFNEYNGSGWSKNSRTAVVYSKQDDFIFSRFQTDNDREVAIRLLGLSTTLFYPQNATRLRTSKPLSLLSNWEGCYRTEPGLSVNDVYSVQVGTLSANEYALETKLPDAWLQLPPDLSERCRRLAAQLTAEAAAPFEKARLIEAYFKSGFQYTLMPGDVPQGKEVCDYFLFETKAGYCTYFATAMAVLCRCAGLPARYVSGYVAKESEKTAENVYIIRKKNAHAWVQVYIEGAGWVGFDPTPAQTQANPDGDAIAVQTAPVPPEQAQASAPQEESDQIARRAGIRWMRWLLIPMGLALGAIVCLWRAHRRRLKIFSKKNTNEKIRAHFYRITALLGLSPAAGQTAMELIRASGNAALKDVSPIILKAFYAKESCAPSELSQIERLEEQMRRDVKKQRPFRYLTDRFVRGIY